VVAFGLQLCGGLGDRAGYVQHRSANPYQTNHGGADDLTDPRSWNRYVYAGSDPVNYYDHTGLPYEFTNGDPEDPGRLTIHLCLVEEERSTALAALAGSNRGD
jgi:hypothetical protein